MSDVSKTSELIAEARERVPYGRGNGDLLARLADALEAATRVPVQGEPNDDREALNHIRVTAKANARWRRLANKTIRDAEAERDAALAALERVRAIALQHRSVEQHNEMVPVTDIADLIREPSSADYLVALDGAPEPEWEYGSGPEDALDQSGLHTSRTAAERGVVEWNEFTQRSEQMGGRPLERLVLVRRRKAGPWLPVEGESK